MRSRACLGSELDAEIAMLARGRDDQLISASYADDFAALIPGSKVAVIDDCGHIPQVEQLEQTATVVDGFLG